MAAYVIGQVTIHDQSEYEKYLAGFIEAFEPFGGRILVAADEVQVVEGTWPRSRTVVLEFPSADQAKRWYESPKYQAIVQHRFKGATANIIVANGFGGE